MRPVMHSTVVANRAAQALAYCGRPALQSLRTPFLGGSVAPRQLNLAGTPLIVQRGAAKKQPRRGELAVRAAFFGVGAPEAVLVGVVALVVFGPKGLAQAVKSLGATLRSFSPTIRELASVTNELSSTLQEQIGLDDIRNEFRNPQPPYRLPQSDAEAASTSKAAADGKPGDGKEAGKDGKDKEGKQAGLTQESEDELAAKIAESKRLAWGGAAPDESSAPGTSAAPAAPAAEAGKGQAAGNGSSSSSGSSSKSGDSSALGVSSGKAVKAAAELSLEELEAELARRRQAGGSK